MPKLPFLLASALPLLLSSVAPAAADPRSPAAVAAPASCDERNLVDEDLARLWTLKRMTKPTHTGRDANPARALDVLLYSREIPVEHAGSSFEGVHESVDRVVFRLKQNVLANEAGLPSPFFEMVWYRGNIVVNRIEFTRLPGDLDSFSFNGLATPQGYLVTLGPLPTAGVAQEEPGRLTARETITWGFSRRGTLRGISVRKQIDLGWGSSKISGEITFRVLR